MRACHLPIAAFMLGFSLACAPEPDEAVIALALGRSGNADIQLAREAFGSGPEVPVRFVNDSTGEGTDAEAELGRAYRMVATEHLVGVVGHAGSRASLVAGPLYNEEGVVQLVPTGTSRRLRDVGPWTFTLAPNDSVEGAAIGRFVAEDLGARRVTVFFVTDEYGYGLREGVVADLRKRGVEVLDEVPVRAMYQMADAEAGDVESLVLASMDRGRPDVVVLAARDFLTRIAMPAVLNRYPDVRFVAGDGVLLPRSIRDELASLLDRLHVVVFWNPAPGDSLSMDFAESYRRVAGTFPTHDHALLRDGLHLLAAAVQDVGPDPARVREYLLSLGRGRPPFQGVTGPISFQPDRTYPVFLVRADSLVAR